MKGWKNLHHTTINQKKAIMARLMSDKVYFRAEKGSKQRETLYNKMSIHIEVIMTLNVYATSNRGTYYVKHKLIELKETEVSTTIMGGFTSLSKWLNN